MTSSPVVRLHEDNREAGGRYGPLSLCPPRPEPTFTVAVRRTPFRAAANLCRLRRVTPSTHHGHVARPVSDVPRSSARSLFFSSVPSSILRNPFLSSRPTEVIRLPTAAADPAARPRSPGREREGAEECYSHSLSQSLHSLPVSDSGMHIWKRSDGCTVANELRKLSQEHLISHLQTANVMGCRLITNMYLEVGVAWS